MSKIVAFVCNWCGRTAVELAKYERFEYPEGLTIIYVNCTGRIDVQLILETLQRTDGVLICGCHLGDDHYGSGNYKTLKKVLLTKSLLNQIGENPQRLQLEWISSTEARKFIRTVEKMKKEIEFIL